MGKEARELFESVIARHPKPECEEHPDGDVVSCGWKSAYRDMLEVLEYLGVK